MPVRENPHPATDIDLIEALETAPAAQAGVELEKILRRAAAFNRIPADKMPLLQKLLDDCQLLSYSSIDAENRKEELLERAIGLFK